MVIPVIATIFAVLGINVCVKSLSRTAFVLGNFLLCSVLFLCASWHLAKVMAQTLGYHIQHIFVLGFLCNAWGGAVEGWRGQGRRRQGCQRLV